MLQHSFAIETRGLSRGVGFVSRHSPCVATMGHRKAR